MRVVFEAEVAVWTGGYAWQPPSDSEGSPEDPWLELDDPHWRGGWSTYDPFQRPGFFSEFARIPYHNIEAVVFGAGRGVPIDPITAFVFRFGLPRGPYSTDQPHRARFSAIIDEIDCMRWAWALWKAIELRHEDWLAEYVGWDGDTPFCYLPFPNARRFLQAESEPDWKLAEEKMDSGAGSDLVPVAQRVLSRLLEVQTSRPAPHLHFERHSDGEPVMRVKVDDLAQALWVQFAQVVTGEHELRFCRQCVRPFILMQSTRSDRVFCSKNCTVLDTYYRKKRAREMRAEGMSLRKIVAEVGAPGNNYRKNLETIKRWLAEKDTGA